MSAVGLPTRVEDDGLPDDVESGDEGAPMCTRTSSDRPASQRWADIDVREEVDEEVLRGLQGASRPAWMNFPVTPVGGVTTETGSPKRAPLEDAPRIGVDIGCVITRATSGETDLLQEWGESHEVPSAFDGLKCLVELFGPKNVWIVGQVKPGGLIQKKTEHWLHEACHMCDRTGVLRSNIVFCTAVAGHEGKAVLAERLRLSHFVDDSFQCLCSVSSHLDGNIGHYIKRHNGLLLHFGESVAATASEILPSQMGACYRVVHNWPDLLRVLREAGVKRQEMPIPQARASVQTSSSVAASSAKGAKGQGRKQGAGSGVGYITPAVVAAPQSLPIVSHPTTSGVWQSGEIGTVATTNVEDAAAAGEGVPAQRKRRGTRGGQRNRQGEKNNRHGNASGRASGSGPLPAFSVPPEPSQPASQRADTNQPRPSENARPRLQLKPRSAELGAAGGQAQVSERTLGLFGQKS